MGARIISWINSLYIQRLCRPKRIQNPSPRISNIIRSHYTDVKESNRHRQTCETPIGSSLNNVILTHKSNQWLGLM